MKTVLISGSRNPKGQTAQAVKAVQSGLSKAGGTSDIIFLPPLKLERCRQCDENGWGVCRAEGRCVIEDDLAGLVEKIRQADAVVIATPVYYADLSESLRAFTDRLRRICTHETGRKSIAGKPLVGVCVAGGGGGGASTCCASLEKVMVTCGFDVVDLIPIRRQNLAVKLPVLERAGQGLAKERKDRKACK